ncbi:helix-turn-helix domain-containing protein [Lichenihabitans sp. Uapishka_5]|uniref:winged helix-turn-helix transcriptional regulator n=1 Tax=Lichenihabitans sp. Uapishka_5 TaxID=3037302 RepID=UPI0029E7F41F|nr:helix-turn-helix domain-containing protein [Lichenihabitans sp. Uapishka_5]MDX7951459.1 helix-turn-helix domain-containing protein [Lichenihabitans sp. Uapishka_5]
MAKLRHANLDRVPACAVEVTVGLIHGKWKCVLLDLLLEDTMRFSELQRRLPDITPRMLTNQLREMEEDGLIDRKLYPQVPPKVEYSLSSLGRSLEPVIAQLHSWGQAHMHLYKKRLV